MPTPTTDTGESSKLKNDPRYRALARNLGRQIAAVRKARSKILGFVDAASFARAAGMDASTLSQIENGRRLIDTWRLYCVAKTLQVQAGAVLLDPVLTYDHDTAFEPPASRAADQPSGHRSRYGAGVPTADRAAPLDVSAAIKQAVADALGRAYEQAALEAARATAQPQRQAGDPGAGVPRRRRSR